MSASYLYLLWDHGEHGPNSIFATDRREDVPAMFDRYAQAWSTDTTPMRAKLIELLERDDEMLAGSDDGRGYDCSEDDPPRWPLAHGWGGPHLQVLRMLTKEAT